MACDGARLRISMEGNEMSFLHEKQSRQYMLFLCLVCVCITGFFALACCLQAKGTQRALLERERAIASSLLSSATGSASTAAVSESGAVAVVSSTNGSAGVPGAVSTTVSTGSVTESVRTGAGASTLLMTW